MEMKSFRKESVLIFHKKRGEWGVLSPQILGLKKKLLLCHFYAEKGVNLKSCPKVPKAQAEIGQ